MGTRKKELQIRDAAQEGRLRKQKGRRGGGEGGHFVAGAAATWPPSYREECCRLLKFSFFWWGSDFILGILGSPPFLLLSADAWKGGQSVPCFFFTTEPSLMVLLLATDGWLGVHVGRRWAPGAPHPLGACFLSRSFSLARLESRFSALFLHRRRRRAGCERSR